MSIIVCKDWSQLSEDELEAALDNDKDLFLFNDVLTMDCLKIQDRLKRIWDRINSILWWSSSSSSAANKLREMYVKSRFQASCTELFFREAPRDTYEWTRPWPIACVYEKDELSDDKRRLAYVNNAYIQATWLMNLVDNEPDKWRNIIWDERYFNKSLSMQDHVKYLANDKILVKELADPKYPNWRMVSKLFLLIYSSDTIKRIFKRYWELWTKWWYEEVFQMKLTWKYYLWKTLENNKFSWNIRSAIEVTRDHPIIKRIEEEKKWNIKNVVVNPFGFFETIDKFRKTCNIVLKWKVDNQFNELMQYAVFGDTFIDESFYATRWYDWHNYYINREYVKDSPFRNAYEIETTIWDGRFTQLYYGKWEGNMTKNYLHMLLKESWWHFNETFNIQMRKCEDWMIDRLAINFDTFLITGPDYIESDKPSEKYFQIWAVQKAYKSYT